MDTENTFHRLISLFMLLLVSSCALHSTASAEIPVSTAIDGQFLPWVVNDGEGGAIVMWEDYRDRKGLGRLRGSALIALEKHVGKKMVWQYVRQIEINVAYG